MKIYKYLVVGFLSLGVYACKKSGSSDLAGKGTLSGTAYITDTLSGNIKYSVLKNGTIFLSNLADESSYLYSVKTNSEGNYSFSGIDSEKSYRVYSSTDSLGIKYFGVLKYPENSFGENHSDFLKLYPSKSGQNGLNLIVKGVDGSPVSGVTVWVFSSQNFFNSGTADGKLFDLSTNIYGTAYKLNIASGTYYLRAKTQIGTQLLEGTNSINVGAAGIVPSEIKLSVSPSTVKNSLEIKTLDAFSTPVSSANVYAYRSLATFQLDSLNTHSLFSFSSNASGVALMNNIEAATYYLRVTKIIGKDTLSAEDNITVPTTGLVSKTVIIKK